MTAKSDAERQADRRARLAIEGMAEVRGVFLPLPLHAELKERARRLRERALREQARPTSNDAPEARE